MNDKPKNIVPQVDVLAWLKQHHPELHASAVIERSWVWITANLQGEAHRAVRESIKRFGFVFARREHKLPNGKIAHWAHHGEKPIPFRRKKRAEAGAWSRRTGGPAEPDSDPLRDEIGAVLAELGF